MSTYETVLILKPTLSDPEVAQFVEKTKQSISSDGGELVNHEVWGRRKLTHLIGKAREGVALMKEGLAIQKRAGINIPYRVMTDLVADFYTLVLEMTVPDLGALET